MALETSNLRAETSNLRAEGSKAAQARSIRIDITNDIVCAYCYIGLKQLLLAIDQYNRAHSDAPLDPQIRMLPYQLHANMPDEPIMTRREYLRRRYGEARVATMLEGVDRKMRAVGIEPAPDSPISSTHLAHRLVTHSLLARPSAHLPLFLDLLDAFHARGLSISHRPTLAALAAAHGVFPDEPAALAWLEGKECDVEVRRAYATAQRLGVTGVPFFVFQGKWAASGAMGTDEFVKLLEEVVKRDEQSSTTPSPTSTLVGPDEAHPAAAHGPREKLGVNGRVCEGEVVEGDEAEEESMDGVSP